MLNVLLVIDCTEKRLILLLIRRYLNIIMTHGQERYSPTKLLVIVTVDISRERFRGNYRVLGSGSEVLR